VEGDKEIGGWGADAGSKVGWWKDRTECGVDTVGESETLCALSGGFSASSLSSIASVDTRRTGAGGTRTLGPCTSSWCTRDVVRGRSRWFVWSASRIGSNVGIGNGQSWNKSCILQSTWAIHRRRLTQRAHIQDRTDDAVFSQSGKVGQRARREAGRQSLFRQSRPASHASPSHVTPFYSRFTRFTRFTQSSTPLSLPSFFRHACSKQTGLQRREIMVIQPNCGGTKKKINDVRV
jgi:hypothetical protein